MKSVGNDKEFSNDRLEENMSFDYFQVQELLEHGNGDKRWKEYFRFRRALYQPYAAKNLQPNLVSEANWLLRSQYASASEIGIFVDVGDICYIDFGQAYLNEAGYQHFGIIMAKCRGKVLVIPMSSNVAQYRNAFDDKKNPTGKMHLMQLEGQEGLIKPSVLFLNDLKYINSARVIDVKGHMDPNGDTFKEIQRRMFIILNQS